MENLKDVSNEFLMERIKRSDEVAFNILYDRLWESLYLKAFSILNNQHQSKDIVQDIWINFWERRHKIENNNIKGYLFNAVRFKVYNEFRNSKNKDVLLKEFVKSSSFVSAPNNIEEFINLTETKNNIEKSVEILPKKCKEVFELSRYKGLKNSEISSQLNISQRTVETHISNALKVLRANVALGFIFFASIL